MADSAERRATSQAGPVSPWATTLSVWTEGADFPPDTLRLTEFANVLEAIPALIEKDPG